MLDKLRALFHKADDLDDELQSHLEQVKQERIELGDSPEAAEAYARHRLGNKTIVQEEVFESSIWSTFEACRRYATLALRNFLTPRRSYLFAVVILALGIGMSVTMYSLVDAVLLRPLPFPQQDKVQVIWKKDQKTNIPLVELAYPELADLQGDGQTFESVALLPMALYGYGRTLQFGTSEPVQLETAPVSADFFRVLGVKPRLGRNFDSNDDRVGAAPVVILSHQVWREQFSANPNIVGQQVRLNGTAHTVIGVMAAGIDFPRGVQIWLPLGTDRNRERRDATHLKAIARLRSGVSDETMRSVVQTLVQRQARDFPDFYSSSQESVTTSLPAFWAGSARLHLWFALGASLLLFLAACISAGNLFLSRTLARRREIATRASLGASGWQILLQFGVEGFTAGCMAACGGVLIAGFAIQLLVKLAPHDIPRLTDAGLSSGAWMFAAPVSLIAAMACSVFPAFLVTRMNLEVLLREGGVRTSGTKAGKRIQKAFVLAQAALTFALLYLSALLFVSYRAMTQTEIGFAHLDAVTMNLGLRGQSYNAASRDIFYTKLLDKLRQSPGVSAAGAALLRPFEGNVGWDLHYQFEFETEQRRYQDLPSSNFEVITPGYLDAVGSPVLEGRDISEHDGPNSEQVVLISHSLAERLRKAGKQPIGLRLRFGADAKSPWMKVAGVVANARYRGVTEVRDDIYVGYLQSGIPTNYVILRGSRSPEELTALVRRAVAEIDPSQAVATVATLGALRQRDTSHHRFQMILLLFFAICAMVLAAAGVYSVVAESIAVRSKEIAVRMALGAGIQRMTGEISAGTLAFVLLGEAIGLTVALRLGQAVSELLYHVSATDPAVFLGVFAFLFVVALMSAYFPARSAATRDPRAALQSES